MNRLALLFLPALPLLTLAANAPKRAAERDRSPADLAITADGRWALTANATADTASLVDLTGGTVTAELPVGKRPFCVALSRDGRRAVVTNWLSNDVTLLEGAPPAMKPVATIPVGEEPRGVAISADGVTAYVALAGDDEIAAVDLAARKVNRRLAVGGEPWHLALTPDGKRLAVGCAQSQELAVVDLGNWKLAHSVKMRGHNERRVVVSPDGQWAYLPHIAERGRPATKEFIDLGWVVGSRLGRAPLNEEGPREDISLDTRGKAEGDVDGLAMSRDGNMFAMTAAGTHELLVLHQPLPFVAFGGPGDHIEPEVRDDPKRFRRIPLGGRPLGVALMPGDKQAVVANYLLNALQVVDIEQGTVAKTIPLGGPAEPSLARKGEAIFYDADRSFNHWYSCGTCHTEGHTNNSTFDTFNDGSYGTPKKTLSLRGVAMTPPWTWHGWRKELRDLVNDSMTKSMQGPEPTGEELDAVMAYLSTLEFRPPLAAPADPAARSAIARGAALFTARKCDTCHAPPNYTSDGVYTVGLESPEDVYKGFNPPPLRGVRGRAPYLHDARARNLNEVLGQYHKPSQLNLGADFTPKEIDDVIAFLRSL